MRKKFTIFLMAVMVLTMAAGCSSESGDTAQQTQAADTQTTTPAVTTDPAAVQTAPQNVIGDAKAKQIALDRVSGAKESDIIKFQMEMDDGRQKYEGEIIYNQKEYEFEIDAVSGELLSWSEESVYAD